jgi:hypothetical protein
LTFTKIATLKPGSGSATALYWPGLLYDSVGTNMWVFGGYNGTYSTNAIWKAKIGVSNGTSDLSFGSYGGKELP